MWTVSVKLETQEWISNELNPKIWTNQKQCGETLFLIDPKRL